MLKTNNIYFFDLVEFEEIIVHYLDTGKTSLAKKAIKLGLEQHPASVDLKLLQVELYLFDDQIEKASKLLKRIEQMEPNNEEVFIQKATIFSKKGLHKQAVEELECALQLTDDKVEVWNLIGMEYLYLDDFYKARLNFEKCIDADYEDYSALYNIVYCFDVEKQHKEAIAYLNEYLNKNPYCEVAWHQLGRQYFALEMFTEALTAFDFAVLSDESFIGGYLEKAKTLEQLGNYQQAIDNYLITLELDDPTAFACFRVGECYGKLQQFDTAISYYKKAVHEDPLLDKGWVILSNLYFTQKKYKEASDCVAEVLKIDEDNAVYWAWFSEINLKRGFYEEVIIGLKNTIRLGNDLPRIRMSLADILCSLGKFKEALKVVFDAQKIHKEVAKIEYRLSGLFFILDKKKYAFEHLIKAMNINYKAKKGFKKIFPAVFKDTEIQKLLANHKKIK
ncbi:MAG: tetratricopeptide repeat protein [Polaribacter sp.]